MTELAKSFEPAAIEARWAPLWEQSGVYGPSLDPARPSFCIQLPPPNVTGTLHMGHAFNQTIMDSLTRYHRMRGHNTLWVPGTDHAGIATQIVVERQLQEQGISRHDMGPTPAEARKNFVAKVWEWKEHSGATITRQMRRMGASVSWAHEYFTMDDKLSTIVTETFVRLYEEGLIYRGKRLVSWDPVLKSAVSDLEVESEEEDGSLWHIRYPVEGSDESLVVATTRPETMLGDTAVMVHPDDERYTHLVGRQVRLPITGRLVPVIADDYVDKAFGTGVVKVTPAHDQNDYQVGLRHQLPMLTIFDLSARVSNAEATDVPAGLVGQDRFAARKLIVAQLEAEGLLVEAKKHKLMVPRCARTGQVIEPMLTDQWFVAMSKPGANGKSIAQEAIEVVETGQVKFVPENWVNTYNQWMKNIQDWCISRQLWWGHQIPAWYGPDGHIFVAKTEKEALDDAVEYYLALEGPWKAWVEEKLENFQPGDILVRDEDVLDTWFSSALWPFSTLGWPDKTKELETYYQTDVLVTGFDIIFFWVARMMMMGLHFMDEEPFHTVYVHALVRDKNGAKMSKSKGNVIDPLELIDEYGADALRFTLTIMAAQGRDVKLDPARIAGYRNFGTKLWNATRFAEMNGVARNDEVWLSDAKLTVNRWILTELAKAAREITSALESYRFNDAAGAAYRFVWNTFCDWYLELLKPVFMGDDAAAKAEAQAVAAFVLDEIYKLLHPMMPFITEELWARTAGEGRERATLLCHARWPQPAFEDGEAADEINWLVDLVTGIRSVRSEMNVPAGAVAPLVVVGAGQASRDRLARHDSAIKRLARVGDISFAAEAPKSSAQIVIGEATFCLPLGDLIDVSAEAARLKKELAKVADEIARIDKKLSNPQFVAKAAEEVVAGEREKREEFAATQARLEVALARIQ